MSGDCMKIDEGEIRYRFAVRRDGVLEVEFRGPKLGVAFTATLVDAMNMRRDLEISIRQMKRARCLVSSRPPPRNRA